MDIAHSGLRVFSPAVPFVWTPFRISPFPRSLLPPCLGLSLKVLPSGKLTGTGRPFHALSQKPVVPPSGCAGDSTPPAEVLSKRDGSWWVKPLASTPLHAPIFRAPSGTEPWGTTDGTCLFPPLSGLLPCRACFLLHLCFLQHFPNKYLPFTPSLRISVAEPKLGQAGNLSATFHPFIVQSQG